MDKKVFLAKILLAQIGGFYISHFLVTQVFIGPVPIVRADFKQSVAELPEKTIETAKDLPATVGEGVSQVVDKISIIAGTSSTSRSSADSSQTGSNIPPPWIFGQGPTPLPTSAPLPNQPQSPSDSSDNQNPQIPSDSSNDPEPTSILRLPTFPQQQPTLAAPTIGQQRPTSIPQPTAVPPPSGSGGSSGGGNQQGNASLEQQTVDEINKRRRDAGLRNLTVNSNLTQAARRHSADMSAKNFCGHDGTDGSDPFERMKSAGYTGRPYGETVSCWARTPMQTVDGWWKSPPHHAILTNSSIKEIGLGWVNTHQTAVVGM